MNCGYSDATFLKSDCIVSMLSSFPGIGVVLVTEVVWHAVKIGISAIEVSNFMGFCLPYWLESGEVGQSLHEEG